MPRFASLLIALALICVPTAVHAYSSSQTQNITSTGQNFTFNFNNLPSAVGNVTITVTVQGDYNNTGGTFGNEFATITADGQNLGQVGGQGLACGASNVDTNTVSASLVNDGSLTVIVDNNNNVHTSSCGCSCVTVAVSYTEGGPPTAEANGPYSGTEGSAISLSGSGSTDTGGSITTYQWDCTNDGSFDTSSNSATGSTCTYSDNGTYTARLRVTDNSGDTDEDTATVSVSNVAPTASVSTPGTANEGVALTFQGSATDPGADTFIYTWDFGDGGSASGATVTHAYPDQGGYVATLTVTDDDGGVDTATAGVTISNVDPVLGNVSYPSGNEGAALTFTASATDVAADPLTYSWTFGDGATASGSTVSHTYADDGNYTVGLTVSDGDGGSVSQNGVASVSNVAPTPSIAGATTGSEGVPLSFQGSATDPGADTFTYAWDFGDGNTATGANVTHTWADNGTFTVQLTATDDEGASASTTSTVAIANVDPVLGSVSIPSGSEGASLAFAASASDVAGDTITTSWDFGDGFTGSGATTNHTYADNGTYNVTVTVTDGDGGSATLTGSAVIANVDPTAAISGPSSGSEGASLTFSGSATDPGADTFTYAWDFGDGATGSGATASHTYTDDGTFTVALLVTDDDGGTDTATTSVAVGNVDPTIGAFSVASGNEGETLTFTASASDVSGDSLTYAWDFGDGNTASGASATHAYDDDGSYSVSVTVTDGDGGSASQTGTASIANVDPTFATFVPTTSGDEGAALQFDATGADVPGDVGSLVITWDWGDGTTDTGASLTHAWADDGTFTVTATLVDGDGGTATQSTTVTTANVAPTITSTAPSSVTEGSTWSYTPTVADPGDEVFTWALSGSAPGPMSIDTATGALTWAPTYQDALTGAFSFTLTVDDGDGATDVEAITITVFTADTDGDGLADSWELANGLDPNDPSDANADPDNDGLTNLEEFGLGTNPNVYDGPGEPTLVSPVGGDEVATDSPDLVVDNAVDPGGDVLVYDFEVYGDAGLSGLWASGTAIAEDASGQTTWKVDAQLPENDTYWWRARASDPNIAGAWTTAESFVVNAINEAPDVPVLTSPTGGETAASLTPTLTWAEASDIDGDPLTYDVEVRDAGGVVLTSETGLVGDGLQASWVVDTELAEDTDYLWTARSVDDEGLTSDWATPAEFVVSADNAPPTGVAFTDPLDGDVIEDQSPVLSVSEGVDPEGTDLTYEIDVDSVATFDSGDLASASLPGSGTGVVQWALSVDGVVLPEDATAYARVRAVDADGIASVPEVISFFVRGENTAPDVPVLVSPEDGAETGANPTLVVEDPADPEGDVVFIEFAVAFDATATEVITLSSQVVSAGGGTTEWAVDVALEGLVYWTARAVDAGGATSDWAEPWTLTAPTELVGDDDDSAGGGDGDTGCDCQSSVGGGGSAWAWLLFLPLALLRRRR